MLREEALTSSAQLSVLIVDDDASLRSAIRLNLEHYGYHCLEAADGLDALSLLEREPIDFVLCDVRMPRLDGMAFAQRCRRVSPAVIVVLMTGTVDPVFSLSAVQAGAYDCLTKPFGMQDLVLLLRKAEEREGLSRSEGLGGGPAFVPNLANIVARSPGMLEIFEVVKRLVNFNTTVLLRGESGTGKELLARAIHHNSPRRGKPFVAINCGAIPENLMESELFGHQRGAFTDAARDKVGLFEEANGGTIFLDEIGEMPLHLQVKLLRVLQEQQIQRVGDEKTKKIDVRLIAATLRDLEDDVRKGRFRDDLLYRLNVITIDIPPLRERPEDVEVLIKHFMKKHNRKLGLSIRQIEPEALDCLKRYHWKGNVRELENCIEHALVLTERDAIDMDSLPDAVKRGTTKRQAPVREEFDDGNFSIKQRTRDLEQRLIVKALEKTRGNRTHAAKVLEISHRALLYKLKEYGLEEVGKKVERAG